MWRRWRKAIIIIIICIKMPRLVHIFITTVTLDRIRWAMTWKCRRSALSQMVRVPRLLADCLCWCKCNSRDSFITDTYTVTQAVNALGFGWFQVKLSLCVGLCWMADSMEMTILSVLGPALHCDWNITRYQQALTTTIVFLGMMLSSTFWGQFSDRYGRKPVRCGPKFSDFKSEFRNKLFHFSLTSIVRRLHCAVFCCLFTASAVHWHRISFGCWCCAA